ncbi:PRP38 family-domain-containing protein [Dunaliella salina]|uniref:Pre-mRNA-splicing factor 38 n=1 Tax=Dunaliella salina TaxID=3046 RepID=A0ABQ7GVP0_DUNSA|nr:PRP38 family-domain-containing protein [Dunaliella salina]|eukprot:KAF5838667.1 PRP38 family-domain-containing protein [Dunaliella salina]
MSGPFVYTNTTTFNLESVLRANILGSDYYNKTCLEMSTWEEVIDEIYECVEDVEPWMSGNARGPSTAFCLLHRLFTLKLNTKQVKDTINHRDSPYIRAIGLLFLRYVADPKTLLSWVGPFLADKEELAPSPGGDKVTMGDFVRDIILEQYYFETIFPRIPKPVMDNIVEELKRRGLPYKPKGNAGQGGPDRRGVDDGNKRPPSVKASLSVAFGQRAPNRAGAREDRYASAISHTGKSNTGAAPGPSTAHERVRERSPSNVYGSSRSSRDERDRERGRESRDRDRDRDRERERERDRERGRDYRDRDSDRGRDRDYRDRDYDRWVLATCVSFC